MSSNRIELFALLRCCRFFKSLSIIGGAFLGEAQRCVVCVVILNNMWFPRFNFRFHSLFVFLPFLSLCFCYILLSFLIFYSVRFPYLFSLALCLFPQRTLRKRKSNRSSQPPAAGLCVFSTRQNKNKNKKNWK